MRHQSFINSIFSIGIGTIVSMAIGFFTTPILTRIVDTKEYGQFSVFSMYTGLVLMVLCLGLDQALVRFFYKKEEEEYKIRIFRESFVLPLIFTALVAFAFLVLLKFKIISFEFSYEISVLLSVNVFLNVFFRFGTVLLRLNNHNKLYACINVALKASSIVFSLLFILFFKMDSLLSLSVSATLSIFICVLIIYFSQREYYFSNLINIKFDKTEVNMILKYGYPFIFSMGIISLFQYMDKLSLNYYHTYSEVGIYESSMIFVSIFSIIQTSFNIVWAPKAVDHFEKHPNDKGFYICVYKIITVIMFSIGLFLVLFKDIIVLLLGEKYRDAANIMPFLMFNPIMYTISETTVVGINFSHRSYMHIIIAIVSCITNFIGNTILVPIYGCRGAAVSTGISYIVFFLIRTFISEKCIYFGFEIKKIGLITLLMTIFAWYSTFYKFNYINVLMSIICYLLLCYLYKNEIVQICSYLKSNCFKIKKDL